MHALALAATTQDRPVPLGRRSMWLYFHHLAGLLRLYVAVRWCRSIRGVRSEHALDVLDNRSVRSVQEDGPRSTTPPIQRCGIEA